MLWKSGSILFVVHIFSTQLEFVGIIYVVKKKVMFCWRD